MTKMLLLRRFYPFATRCCNCRKWSSDMLLTKLNNFTHEDQVFSLVAKNRDNFSEEHVRSAIKILMNVQRMRPWSLKNMDYIKSHSQFLELRVLAENKIEDMDNEALVDVLYNILWFRVEAHDSLVEELVVEGWKRLRGLNLQTLSKFALCVNEQQMHHSPLMGEIAEIVNVKLDSIQNARVLSVFMICICRVISLDLQNRLIHQAEDLFERRKHISLNDARRFVQFLRNVAFVHRPLLSQCDRVFLQHLNNLKVEDLCVILGLYQNLQFNNSEFRLFAKQKLLEKMDDCSNPATFIRLFVNLAPMAGPAIRNRLIENILQMTDEFDRYQTLKVVETMQEMKCRNPQLIQKVVFLLHKYLDMYKPSELVRVTQTLVLLHWPKADIYFRLQQLAVGRLEVHTRPADIEALICVLSNLPSPYLDEVVVSRIDAVLPQCSLRILRALATALVKWTQHNKSTQQRLFGPYGKLLQKINNSAFQRLQRIHSLDLLLEELRHIQGEWFQEVLLEKTMATFQRLIDQITWANVLEFASFFTRSNYHCALLLDRIAAVVTEHIDKIYYSGVYSLLLPFHLFSYEPPEAEKFFEACIGLISLHLEYFQPSLLVLLGFVLASTGYFPENVIRTIFNIEFLAKLDAQLEILPGKMAKKVCFRVMELNRAVCLECPELQIPWFHKHFCEQQLRKSTGSSNLLQQQIYVMLGEILGGSHFVNFSVLTPYYYRVDFEFILDKNRKTLPHMDSGKVGCIQAGPTIRKKGLPPGAKRIAVEILDAKAFCQNSKNIKGEIAMKKRHLEILGYQVVQIPHFEWNSMELSSRDAQIEYLKKKVFEKV